MVSEEEAEKAVKKAARKALRRAERDGAEAAALPAAECADEAAPASKRPKPSPADAAAAAAFFALHEIVCHDENAPPPCLALASAPFPPALVAILQRQGFTAPSAVQAVSWPIAVTGRDVLAIAKTGSGKTLGFLLPVLARCHREKPAAKGAPLALIMAPTRELALQIAAEALKFGACVDCRAVAVYGGASKGAQLAALRRGCELIVGTPGRIGDMLDTRGGGAESCVDVSRCSMLVLDEADRMLDMGFERAIHAIVWHSFGERAHQTLLFSATWPSEVQRIAAELLSDSVCKVTVGSGGDKLTANKSITQRVHVVEHEGQRWDALVRLLAPFRKGGEAAGQRVIVFANRKTTVAKIATYCLREGLRADSISGDRNQSQRESTIRRFRDGDLAVVIATDVAARGLDIKGIDRVINYELPETDFQDYVHRIGRTGRAGATGEADSIFTPADKAHAKELIRIMTEAGQDAQVLSRFTSQKKTFFNDDDE